MLILRFPSLPVGPHRVRSGQRIFLTDPDLNKYYDEQLRKRKKAEAADKTAPATSSESLSSPSSDLDTPTPLLSPPLRHPSVILRFSTLSSSGETTTFAHAIAGTALFGGIVSPPSPLAPSVFSPETPPLALVLPPSHPINAQGCAALPPTINPSLLLLRRGGCTFQQKLARARSAGYAGAVVWEQSGSREVVQPAGELASDPAAEGREVLLFLPGGVGAMGAKLERRLIGLGKKLDGAEEAGKVMMSVVEGVVDEEEEKEEGEEGELHGGLAQGSRGVQAGRIDQIAGP